MGKLGVVALLLLVLSASGAGGSIGSRIVFARADGLIVETVDGASQTNVSAGPAGEPTWSPDATRIAFTTNRDTQGHGQNELYVVSADGAGLRRLTFDATATTGAKGSPAWSPDGSQIAFLEGAAIDVISSAGGARRTVATGPEPLAGLSWSPDGTKLLTRSYAGVGAIYVVNVASGAITKLVAGIGARWSPDGTRIAYADAAARVAVMDADGTHARELTARYSSSPTWLNDRSLAFVGQREFPDQPPAYLGGAPTRTNIYVADVDGIGAPRRVTGSADEFADYREATLPQASPDGAEILFEWTNPGWWRMNADGTCAQPVPVPSTASGGPFWAPDARPGITVCVEPWVNPLESVRPSPVALGQPAVATVTVENHGNEAATNVVVHTQPVHASTLLAGCTPDCAIGTIPPGATATASVSIASKVAGMAGFTYAVTSDQPSPAPQLAAGTDVAQILPCTIVGTPGADRLYGTPRRDTICALPGNDYISGGAGDDTIYAGSGNDTVYGGPGHDTIYAGGGRDTIFARDGMRDTIDCGAQYDVAVVDRFDRTTHCERVIRG